MLGLAPLRSFTESTYEVPQWTLAVFPQAENGNLMRKR